SPIGTWWASVPQERWPDHAGLREYLEKNWEEPWGDRRQELVFIGSGIDWPALEARLNAALLPEDFNGDLDSLSDPFPQWRRQDIQQ
ncbi:MAG: GTP-binding protein, partial [Pseudomonadota bacterium]